MPSVNGEKIVLRILERSTEFATLAQVGMEGHLLDLYKPYLDRPNGIILVTGPTGSGKTTTLYASLLAMNRENKNVVTVEDPVEYHIDNITQVQVNPPANITFANAIRAFLRQDPDIILVGEIRDTVTAEAAVQASLTGHLVLSTLHTNDAPTAVSRLIEMDVEPFLISSSLLLVIGQRLVRKVCPQCRTEVQTDPTIRKIFNEAGFDLPSYIKGSGCENCFQTGYRGRIGIFEMLSINDDIRRLVNRSASAFEIREEARKHGYVTMFEHGVEIISKGLTTPEELLSVTRSEQ
jgi:general secretion pathway protein E